MRKNMFRFMVMVLLVSSAVSVRAGNWTADTLVNRDAQNTTTSHPPVWVAPKTPDRLPGEKVIQGVPGYEWWHGCGPTSLGMVIGYYDANGYPDLIPGDASTQTSSVNQVLASFGSSSDPRHYEDYAEPLDAPPTILSDRSEDPPGDEHSHDCIADYMRTSFSIKENYYGWSWASDIGRAWEFYLKSINPAYHGKFYASASSEPMSFNAFKQEIDNSRPMVLLVDTDGDDLTDHFVTAVGYRDNGGTQEYGCLDTWAPADQVRWCEYVPMAPGVQWGISRVWKLWIENSDQKIFQIDDGAPDGTLGYTDSNNKAVQFIWFNQFSIHSSDLPLRINRISAVFPNSSTSIGDQVELVVFHDATGGAPSDATCIYTENVSVQSATFLTWSEYTLTSPVVVTDPGDLIIGVIDRFVVSGVTSAVYPAIRDSDTSEGRSWVAIWAGDPPDPPDLSTATEMYLVDDIGFPGNFMIRAFYSEADSPTPTPGPGDCTQTGVTIHMPSSMFHANDPCSCSVTVCNAEGAVMNGYPLFVILGIGNVYFCAPDFNDFSYFDQTFNPGESIVEVLSEFTWPSGAGSYSGAVWYAAFTNPEITDLFGTMDTFTFGWAD